MGWGVEDKSFFLLNVPLVMQKKKKNKRKKINPWVFFFYTPFNFTGIPAFTKVSVSQTVCIQHSHRTIQNSSFAFLARTHFPDFFLFLVFVLNFTTAALPCPEVTVSVDTGGSPVRCGSALCQTRWRRAVERWRAVLSAPRMRPSAGLGLRMCGRTLSGPDRTHTGYKGSQAAQWELCSSPELVWWREQSPAVQFLEWWAEEEPVEHTGLLGVCQNCNQTEVLCCSPVEGSPEVQRSCPLGS